MNFYTIFLNQNKTLTPNFAKNTKKKKKIQPPSIPRPYPEYRSFEKSKFTNAFE